MNEKVQSDEEILFPNIKIGNIVLKPWSFGILFEISNLLESVLDKADAKGITEAVSNAGGFISYITMLKLFTIASDELLSIVAITLGKEKNEIRALPMEDGIKIVIAIYNQNSTIIKNALSSLLIPKPNLTE
jgi:hypothetical protein